MNLTDLVERTGISTRTIRFYIQQGVMPGPDGMGPKSTYHEGHLARLQLIRAWQEQFLPLAEIRNRLEKMDDAEVLVQVAKLEDGTVPPAKSDSQSAAAYALNQLAKPMSASAAQALAPAKFTWERISLSSDFEIHVRRPLSRADNRRLDQLLEVARTLFAKGTV